MQGNGSQGGHGPAEPSVIVLTGVSGCGKTTVGKLLAPSLGATFLEGDDYHPSSNVAKMRAGTPLSDEDRWPWLETLGHAITDHAARGRSIVVACSALRRAYRDALSTAARRPLTFVHLTLDPATLEARMQTRRQHFMPVSLLESQLATLEPLQPDEDGTEIRETGPASHTVEAIRRWLRRHESGAPMEEHDKGRRHHPLVEDK